MELKALGIKGSWLAKSQIWSDERGYFREWFKPADILATTGYRFNVEQANLSSSTKGVIRGIHYSIAEPGQAKWVTCVSGSIRDFIVDIRTTSPTFGEWISADLSAGSGSAVLIGANLGHAFVSLEENSIIAYLLSSPYSPKEEFEINPMDPDIGIKWGVDITNLTISKKDKLAPMLHERSLRGQLPK